MIKMIILDVDGTLTDGKIYMGPNGEIMKAFNAHDAIGVRKLKEHNIIPVIITGRKSDITINRAREMDIDLVYQEVLDKLPKLKEIAKKFDIDFEEIAYIGDDENDLKCMEVCGLKCCPNDAMDIIKTKCNIISKYNGGSGAVREIIEIIINRNEEIK